MASTSECMNAVLKKKGSEEFPKRLMPTGVSTDLKCPQERIKFLSVGVVSRESAVKWQL